MIESNKSSSEGLNLPEKIESVEHSEDESQSDVELKEEAENKIRASSATPLDPLSKFVIRRVSQPMNRLSKVACNGYNGEMNKIQLYFEDHKKIYLESLHFLNNLEQEKLSQEITR